jgi:hypothetical protein
MLAEEFPFQVAFGREFPRAIPIVAGPPALYPQTELNRLWQLRMIQEDGDPLPYKTLIFVKCSPVSARIELHKIFPVVSFTREELIESTVGQGALIEACLWSGETDESEIRTANALPRMKQTKAARGFQNVKKGTSSTFSDSLWAE